MSVHYLKNRRLWFVKWREEGKEKRKYFSTEIEANAFEAERKMPAENGCRLTLGELVVKFFHSRKDYHPESKRKIVNFLSDGNGAFMRDKYAEALCRKDLQQMRDNFLLNGSGNNTINKYQAIIRAILSWGVENEYLHFNPWRDFKKLKTTAPNFHPKIEDLQKLFPFLPEYLQWAVKTAFFLALRPGQVELFSLTWDAFNWQRACAIIRQGKTGRLKTVILHPSYQAEAFCRYQEDMKAGIPLVCHRNGKKVLSFRTAWNNAMKQAGVKLRPYDIRHIAASEMLAHGADLAAVAAQLGHSSVATTGAIYAHVTAGSQSHAASLMPAIEKKEK